MTDVGTGREFYVGLLEALTGVMGTAKGYLGLHGPRVAVLAHELAGDLGMDDRARSELVFGAVLSDMGMIGLAEDAWENPVSELSDEVRARVRMHPERSQLRVREIPHLEALDRLVRSHHEWWNGDGYPDGLGGEEIPAGARVLRLADTVTALGGLRPHRGPLEQPEIEEIVAAGSGEEFGPEEVAAYLARCRAGTLPRFRQEAYRELLVQAANDLLPEELSALSTNQLLTIIANLIDAKDPYTGGHSRRVALLAVSVADQLSLPGELKSALWAIGFLHDLGKLAVPLRVLAKEGRLTDEEFDFIRQHPVDGTRVLEGIPSLRHLVGGVLHHHERWDGRGYPNGVAGEEIPVVARVIAVCDAFDAMTSKRAYRDSLGTEYALEEIAAGRGGQFAAEVADGFLAVPRDIIEGLHRPTPEAFRQIPERVGTLRHIDPRWFTSDPTGPA